MNPAQLLANFHRLAEAPDAIPRLRRFILDLAVRGKLVPQDPKDEPASELLKRIQEKKAQMVKEGRIRKQQPLPSLGPDEIPFELPERWQWLRLGEIGFTQTGTTPSSNNPEYFGDYIPFVKPADLTGNIINYSGDGISKEGVVHSRLIPKHSVLMVCIGSSIGKVNVNDRDVCCNQQINTVTPYLGHLTTFTSFALKATYFQKLILANAGMGTLPIISKGKWEILPIPLPPLAEQHRIVTKVDELMGLCDRLEAVQTERENRRDRLVAASLHRLNNGADAQSFRDHARFHLRHLPRLTTRPAHIQQLRQTILNFAVRGQLVPQDPDDEPASELIERISQTKRQLVVSKKLRKPEALEPLAEEEIRFNVPALWSRTRLGAVYDVRDGTHDTPKYVETGYPLITSKNLSSGRLSFDDIKLISEHDHRQISERSAVEKWDILLAMIGSIGNPVIVDTDRPFSIKNVALFKYYDRDLSSPGFLCLFLQHAAGQMRQLAAGGLQPFVSLGFLRSYPIALPPLAEQHRIVAKVNELMALCNRLEAQLATAQSESHRLLESVLHQALAPTAV